jgi:hypothetical protein
MTEVATGDIPLKSDALMTKRQGLNRDLPPGKEQWMWVIPIVLQRWSDALDLRAKISLTRYRLVCILQ